MKTFYMDANASTPTHPRVAAAVADALATTHGNPSSAHAVGQAAMELVDSARSDVAAFMGAEASNIVFASGATEANASAILGIALAQRPITGRRTLLVSAVEHPSVHHAADFASTHLGFGLSLIPVDRFGRVTPETLAKAIDDDTAVVAVMGANNETGCVNDLDAIVELCSKAGTPLIVDMVQLAGKTPLSVAQRGIAAAVVSGHKFGGPKGVAALYLRPDVPYTPLFGGSQEHGRRGGTENVAGIVGLGVAAAASAERLAAGSALRAATRQMRTAFEALGDVAFNTPDDGLPNTLSVSFHGLDARRLVMRLNRAGVHVSSGSACSSGSATPSHVLTAIGLDRTTAMSTVRFSLDPSFPFESLAEAIDRILGVVSSMGKFGKGRPSGNSA
jgi:cysteine desulfurase